MQESLLARCIKWLIFATAAVPLVIFSQYISPFHFGKVVIFRSLVEIMLALYLMLIWRDRSYLPKSHWILWAFAAFTGAFTLTSITSVAWLQSFWGTLERMGGLFTFWHYFIFYIIAVAVMRTRKDWEIFFDLIIVAGVGSALYGVLQRTDWSFIIGGGGRQRIFGTIGNPALFAGYEILVGFMALSLAMLGRTIGTRKRWYFVAGAIMLFAAAMTAVRGSLMAIGVAIVLYLLLYSSIFRSAKARRALVFSIAGVLVLLFMGVMLRNTPLVQNSPYLKRVTDVSPKTFTVQTRFWAWSAGFKGWSDSPKTMLVGWGPENFNVPFSKYFNPKFFTGPGAETFFDRAHNMFVEILVTMGLVGELTYLSIFAALFYTLYRFMKSEGDTRLLGLGLTSLTVAYIIHNSFIFDTSANFITFFSILAFVTHVSARGIDAVQAKPLPKSRQPGWTAFQGIAATILFVATFIVVYTFNVVPSMANYASTRAIVAGWQGDWVVAINKYRESIDYDVPGRYEYRHRFAQYLLEVGSSTDISKVPNFKEVALQAVEDVKKNTEENPRDYLPYLYISRLYITLGKDDAKSPYNQMALDYSGKALEISPTFVRTFYEVAQAYLNMKQYDKAVQAFRRASDLNPDVSVTWWYLGMVEYQKAVLDKDVNGVRRALEDINTALNKGYSLSENDAEKLVGIYTNIGDEKDLLALYQQLVQISPANPRYWSSLGVELAKQNRTQEAIVAVQKAIQLNANDAQFVQQANAFLKQLGAK